MTRLFVQHNYTCSRGRSTNRSPSPPGTEGRAYNQSTVKSTLASAWLTLWLLSGCVLQPGAQVVWTFETPPGATAFEAPLRESLAVAWTRRPADYVPRTRHLRDDGSPRYINRLFLQSSP